MTIVKRLGHRATDEKLVVDTLVARRVRPIVVAFVSITALVAVLSFLVSASQALAAPSANPDPGTVQVDGRVNAILPVGNRIYLGGEFTHVDGVSRNYLAAVDATTGQLTDWSPSANARVRALAASPDGTRIYAGGSFSQVNGLTRWRLVSLDATTGAVDPNWRPTPDSGVYALAVSGDRLYVGGNFLSIDGQGRSHLALLDRSTGALDPNWTPAANNNIVRSLTISADGNKVYAGGDFTTISGQSKPYLASLDASSGTPDGSFRPPSPNGEIFALALLGGRVYTAEGGPGGAMAAYDAATGTRAWRNTADGDAESITALGNKVYVAGHFELVGSQARDAFAAFDPSTGALDPNWTPVAQPVGTDVWALASDASRGRVYAGGDFTGISGQNRQRFAQFSDPLVSSDTTPPTVGSVTPADRATDVTLSSNVDATFSEAMDATTLNSTTFTLKQGTNTVAATVSYDAQAKKATLDPTQDLAANSTYTATIKGGTNGVKDVAGNALVADKTWSFTTGADTSPPDTTIVSGPTGAVNSTSATFEFSSSETGSTFVCSLDGVEKPCTSPMSYTGLAQGAHTFQVKATDTANNTDPTPASRSWTVDTVVPDAPAITSPAENAIVGGSSFTLSGTAEPNTTVEVFEGTNSRGTTQANGSGVWSKALSGVSDGTHTYTAKATDAAGNTSSASNTRTITVDATSPDTTITSGPSGNNVSSTSATFTFTSSEANSTFECSLDGAAFQSCSSPNAYTGLSNGSHTFRVRAKDVAGNLDATPASRTWKIRVR